MKKKTILLIVLGLLLLVSIINFSTGTTTITINGKQVTSLSGYTVAYLGLIILTVMMAIVIPSVYLLAVMMVIIFVVCTILFFPFLPMATLFLPAIVLSGIVWLVYKLVKKKRK
jgi:hypothetical protein